MNLIYTCIFNNLQYLQLLELFLISGLIFGDIQEKSIDILIITTDDFVFKINELFGKLELNCNTHIISLDNIYISLSARFYIFDYIYIEKYSKILYLDTDILITNSLKKIFNLIIENKIYALSEGTIGDEYH